MLSDKLFIIDLDLINESVRKIFKFTKLSLKRKVSSWVSGADISVHVTDVIFTLLDDDGDGR